MFDEAWKKREFHKFYKKYYKLAYLFLRAKRFPYNSLRDILSQVFEAAWNRFDEYLEDNGKNKYWFYNILRDKSKYAMNKLIREKKCVLNEDIIKGMKNMSTEEQYLELEKKTYFFSVIMELPEIYREVVTLRIEGLNYQEISELLNISVDTAKQRMKRATEKLKSVVANNLKAGL